MSASPQPPPDLRPPHPARPLIVGVIGCGNVSWTYLRSASLCPSVRWKSCADLDPSRSSRLAAEFGLAAVDGQELLADPDIDLVLNLTPPNQHARVSLAAIAGGKHVFSEKPLATALSDARAIVAAARARGVRVGCAPDTFLGAPQQAARRLLDEGAIGTPLAANACFASHGMEGWHPDPRFFFQPGGGPMLDMGSYYVAALVHLLGPAAWVMGMAGAGFASRRIGSGPRQGQVVPVTTPTHLAGTIEFRRGALVSLSTSWDVWRHRVPHLEVHGTEGSLSLPDPNDYRGLVEISRRGEPWRTAPGQAGDGFAHDVPEDVDRRGAGLEDLARAISRGEPHRAGGEAALHALEVMLAFEASHASGRRIAVESPCPRPAPLHDRQSVGRDRE